MRYLATAALILAAAPALAEDAVMGQELYGAFCTPCHGDFGQGDGPLADMLSIQPTDLSRLADRNDGVFPVAQVVRQIDGRDPDLKHGGIMPLFGAYFDGEDIAIQSELGQPIMTNVPTAELVLYLREIQR